MIHNKIGIADYGMNCYYGGLLDYEKRMEDLRTIGYDGAERMEPIDAADAMNKMIVLAKLGMDCGTVRTPRMELSIQYTAALGKKYVWVDSPDRRDGMDEFVRQANYLADVCEKYHIVCALHNHMGTPTQNVEEVEEFLRRCPRIGVVFDVGHMALAGGDVVKFADKYADRIVAVHLKEWTYTSDDRTLAWNEQGFFCGLGQGKTAVDNQGVVDVLRKKGYCGWFHIEQDTHHREPLEDLKNSWEILRSWGLS